MGRINRIKEASLRIVQLLTDWENRLLHLSEEQISLKRNTQNRNVKQILGHLIDSAVNNHHRIVRLQYQKRLSFPDYQPDNDSWIHIQNYEDRDWALLVQFWKLYGLHISFIMNQVNEADLDNLWTDGFIVPVSLEDIICGFPCHFELHLTEIQELIEMV